jgi:hypothetical protein
MQLAYGTFALLCAMTTFRGRRWARFSRMGWIVSCALAAAMAFVVTWLLEVGARDLTNLRAEKP